VSRNVVFFAADRTYLPIAWTAAKTAAAEPGRDFDVLILTEDAVSVPAPPGCRILQMALPAVIQGWPRLPHASPIAYARLAAAELVLGDYERAVYIDSDTSIHGPLAALFALDLRGAVLAMVEDCGRYLRDAADQAVWDDYRRALGLDPAAVYFNSGVIVMDLAAMRAMRLWRQAQDFIATHGERLIFMDQDVLNVLAAGRIAELSPRWNFMTHFFGLGLEAEVMPRIRHYVDVLKPWRDPEWQLLHGLEAPRHFARLFADSPWAGYVPRGLYGKFRLPWQSRAALRQAENARQLTPEAVAAHVAYFQALAARLRVSVRQRFSKSAAEGRYIDGVSNEF